MQCSGKYSSLFDFKITLSSVSQDNITVYFHLRTKPHISSFFFQARNVMQDGSFAGLRYESMPQTLHLGSLEGGLARSREPFLLVNHYGVPRCTTTTPTPARSPAWPHPPDTKGHIIWPMGALLASNFTRGKSREKVARGEGDHGKRGHSDFFSSIIKKRKPRPPGSSQTLVAGTYSSAKHTPYTQD